MLTLNSRCASGGCLTPRLFSFRHRGLRLIELSDLFIREANVRHAVNLDGGGSSVLVVYEMVYSHPTCLDLPIYCERPVASVVCVRETTFGDVQ